MLWDVSILWSQSVRAVHPASKSAAEPYAGFGTGQGVGRSEQEMTTPLFLLQSVELGISISDLDLLTVYDTLELPKKSVRIP